MVQTHPGEPEPVPTASSRASSVSRSSLSAQVSGNMVDKINGLFRHSSIPGGLPLSPNSKAAEHGAPVESREVRRPERTLEEQVAELRRELKGQQAILARLGEQLLSGGVLQTKMESLRCGLHENQRQQEVQAAALREGLMDMSQQREELNQQRADLAALREIQETAAKEAAPRSPAQASVDFNVELAEEMASLIQTSRRTFLELKQAVDAEKEARTNDVSELRGLLKQANSGLRANDVTELRSLVQRAEKALPAAQAMQAAQALGTSDNTASDAGQLKAIREQSPQAPPKRPQSPVGSQHLTTTSWSPAIPPARAATPQPEIIEESNAAARAGAEAADACRSPHLADRRPSKSGSASIDMQRDIRDVLQQQPEALPPWRGELRASAVAAPVDSRGPRPAQPDMSMSQRHPQGPAPMQQAPLTLLGPADGPRGAAEDFSFERAGAVRARSPGSMSSMSALSWAGGPTQSGSVAAPGGAGHSSTVVRRDSTVGRPSQMLGVVGGRAASCMGLVGGTGHMKWGDIDTSASSHRRGRSPDFPVLMARIGPVAH